MHVCFEYGYESVINLCSLRVIRFMVESGNVHRPNSDSLIVSASRDHQMGHPRTRRKIHREGGFRIKNKRRTSEVKPAEASTPSKLRKDSPMPTRSERLQILRSLSLSALPFKETEQQQQQQPHHHHQHHHRHSSSSDMSELSSGEVPVVIPWITGACNLGLSRPGSGRTTDSGSTLVEKGQDSPAAHRDDPVPPREPLFQRTLRTLGQQDSDRGGDGAVGGVGVSSDVMMRDRRHQQQLENSAGGIHHLFHTDSDSVNSGRHSFVFSPIDGLHQISLMLQSMPVQSKEGLSLCCLCTVVLLNQILLDPLNKNR